MTDIPPPPPDPRAAVMAIRSEVAKVVVGQDGVVTGLVTALLVNGHVLLEGVPGVAKTLLAKTLAASLDLRFNRVQFTPDLMPSDVIGQNIFDQRATNPINASQNNEIWSDHPGLAGMVFCDGHVEFVSETIEQAALVALLTLAGGD